MNKNFGLADVHFNFILDTLKSALSSKKNYSVCIFGSRAFGKEKKYSDLDIWIDSTPDFSKVELTSCHTLFEESDLPIKVDIVTPKTCLEDYKPNIERQKVLWFEKKKNF